MKRVVRVDYAASPIEIVETLTRPTADRSPAIELPGTGYLRVDAYLARDGLLRYSDGKDSWIEYRPREELVAAAESWAHAPVTDGHPPVMVTADSWSEVARGVHMAAPTVEGPDPAGVSYLRAPLLITDSALIAKIKSGVRQTSIGFTTQVVPAVDGAAPDGTRCDGVQTALVGNHTAVLPRGRAGPAVRVLFDGAEVPVYDGPVTDPRSAEDPHVKTKQKTDEMGSPSEVAMVSGPDGQSVQVPSWIAAQLAEYAAMKAAPQPPAAPAPAAPPADPAADAPGDPPAAPASPDDEEKKKDPMTPDQIHALVQAKASRLSRIVRLADKAGVPATVCDSADEVAISRAYVAARCPELKAAVEKADGAALDAFVAAAQARPEPARNPFEPRPRDDRADELDADDLAELKFLASQGYA